MSKCMAGCGCGRHSPAPKKKHSADCKCGLHNRPPRRLCWVSDCDDRAASRQGLCKKHWKRWSRHGDPLAVTRRPANLSLEESFRWFMPGEPPRDTCWEWTGYLRDDGYGQLRIQGRTRLAHTISYIVFVGPVPAGKELLHSCDNPPCVNPLHLVPDTHLRNMQEMVERGRQGYRNTKLVPEQVLEIRRLYASGNLTQAQIAESFGVSIFTVRSIVKRLTWRHLPEMVICGEAAS